MFIDNTNILAHFDTVLIGNVNKNKQKMHWVK